MKGLIPQAQHYEEALPSDNAEVKASHAKGEETLARFQEMKFKAMLKGYIITGQPRTDNKDYEKLFAFKNIKNDPNAPKLKMKDLILNSLLARFSKRDDKIPH